MESPYSVTTPPVPVSLSLPHVTFLGLEVQDLDEGKSQVAHGETVRETANMISFMADVIGIRDDMYIGKGNKYMHEVVDAVTRGQQGRYPGAETYPGKLTVRY